MTRKYANNRMQKKSNDFGLKYGNQKRWEQDQTEKFSSKVDWLQNDIWYGSAKLNNKLLQNVQNIRWVHKLYWENHENLKSGITNRKIKTLAEAKIQRGIFQEDALSPLLFIIAMMPLDHT